jgi:arsenite-transporting ATPase
VPRFTFFIGKGGVGKTTVSSAYALYRAAQRRRARLLLLSTDPAHSLADVLQVKLGDRVQLLANPGELWARQIDSRRQIRKFLRGEREGILALLSQGSLFTREELEPLLDTSLPGMAEVAALLAIHELLDSDYDEVVVDTAPMGHAIRLLQMPEHFARFLVVLETAAAREAVLARHFGGRVRREPALERWARMVERVEEALSAGASRLILVTTPEPFSLNEAARCASAFQIPVAEIVLNHVVRGKTSCPRCRARASQSSSARRFLCSHFPQAKLFTAADCGCPILGTKALRSFGAHVFAGRPLPRWVLTAPRQPASFQLQPAAWPRLATPLTLTLGKGGVGKTTLSAALAYQHRTQVKSAAVTVCSIDPAPSLDDVFAAKVGNELRPVLHDRKLLATEFDAVAQYRQWAAQWRARLNKAMSREQGGIHLDLSLDRQFLLALLEVVPPGVDEILAVFRVLDSLRRGSRGPHGARFSRDGVMSRVVIDMAPTGHALEVLRTPARLLAWSRLLLKTLAAHRTLPIARDAAVEIATLSQNVRELAAILSDGKRCRLLVVTLAELLPDYELRRLLRSLRELQAPVGAVFVNRVLTEVGRCAPCRRAAQWQAASLVQLRRLMRGREVFVLPEFDAPIAGAKGLREFTRQLWRLA